MNRQGCTVKSVKEKTQKDPSESFELFQTLSLKEQVEYLLNLKPEERVKIIQRLDNPAPLVRRLPAEEVLLTVETVGMEEALPVLAATSAEQFNFLTDIEIWGDGEITRQATRKWLLMLVKCGEAKILDWLQTADFELIQLVLKKFLIIYKTEPNDTPEINLPHFTLDGVYHFVSEDIELLDAFRLLLTLLRSNNPELYYILVESIFWEDIYALEHRAAKLRTTRLAEYGFPETDEACEIYRYISLEEAFNLVKQKSPNFSRGSNSQIIPKYPLQLLDQNEALMVRSLQLLKTAEEISFLTRGLITVAHHIQVVDHMPLGRLASIKASAAKTAGYINIALEYLAGNNPSKAAELLSHVSALHLFRIGNSRVEDVARRARFLVRKGWLKKLPVLEILDSPQREVLKGLLGGYPRFYTGEVENDYRDFRSRQELELVNGVLQEIEGMGHLFLEHLKLTPERLADILKHCKNWAREHDLRLSTILMTAAVRFLLGQPFKPEPLKIEEVNQFLSIVLKSRTGNKRKFSRAAKNKILQAIAEESCTTDHHLHPPMLDYFNRCWRRMEQELANVTLQKPPDARWIQVLIVQ